MSFILFFFYMTLCLIIYGILGVLLYKFYFKKKKNDFLDTNIDNIWDSFYSTYNNEKNTDSNRKEDKDHEKVYSSF